MAAPDHGPLAGVSEKVRHRTGWRHDGLLPITGNKEALEYRLAMIDSSRSSLDIQMFFWMKDLAGSVLLERVFQAADRGVRVRLLLDDLVLGLTFKDKELAAINSHPNIEVRIYNPFHRRGGLLMRSLEMLANHEEKNQRMHNKAIIADNTLAILSGRNVGSHCFGYGKKYNLVDLGVIMTGPVVSEISRSFDRYWNCGASYSVEAFPRLALDDFRLQSNTIIKRMHSRLPRAFPTQKQNWSHLLTRLHRGMHKGHAEYLADAPEISSTSRPVLEATIRMAAKSQHDLILVTPYIVPDRRVVDMISSVRKRGVRVRLLLPSIGSNNHPIVHNQYQKYRKLLLALGVEIYEFKHRPGPSALQYLNEGSNKTRKVGLHSKAVVVDSRYCYIGTLNFDGRAIFVNTEEGVCVDSPPLARVLRQTMEELMLPENAWRLTVDKRGRFLWVSGKETRRSEPTLNVLQATLETILRPFHVRIPAFPDQQVYRAWP